MRRLLLAAAAFAVAATAVPSASYAQNQRRQQDDQRQQEQEARKKRQQQEEWGDRRATLPAMRNSGPCPFVKTLYDAARYVEFKDGREASANVGFTGEIQGISAGCEYKDDKPIKVTVEMLFELGRGPQAQGREKSYRYWVAVTDRNREVIAKEWFDLPVKFDSNEDRVYMRETLSEITIPRAEVTTSGANFEVLIGFDVTPAMAAFNRDGKRFRLNVGQAAAATPTP